MIRARCHVIDGEACDWLGSWRNSQQLALDDGNDHVEVAHDYIDGVTATRGDAAFGLEDSP